MNEKYFLRNRLVITRQSLEYSYVESGGSVYRNYLEQETLLTESAANEDSDYTLLSNGVSRFNSAVITLITHNESRVSVANLYAN